MKFPPVGVDHVLGLLKVIHNLGGRADAMHINDAVEKPLREFQKYLRRRLSEAEPFASLARLVSERGKVKVEEVLEFLSGFGYSEEGRGGFWTEPSLRR